MDSQPNILYLLSDKESDWEKGSVMRRGRQSITSLEGSQASPARPSGKSSLKWKRKVEDVRKKKRRKSFKV
jgi:hypothetical protein